MSRIKSKRTRGEERLYEALEFLGIRTERWGKIFGKPDFLISESKIAIFMDGDFWHGCPTHFKLPKTRRKWWEAKFKRNKERDQEVNDTLTGMGYLVLRFWECQVLSTPLLCAERVRQVLSGHDPVSAG